MKDLDQKIKEALHAQNPKWGEEYQREDSVFSLISDTFHSRQRWLVGLVIIYVLLFSGLMIYCGYSFFGAETVRDQILFATGTLFAVIVVSILKMWYWMELNKHAHTREIKKLELQIARLSALLVQDKNPPDN